MAQPTPPIETDRISELVEHVLKRTTRWPEALKSLETLARGGEELHRHLTTLEGEVEVLGAEIERLTARIRDLEANRWRT